MGTGHPGRGRSGWVSAIGVPAFLYGKDGECLGANAAAERLTSKAAEELVPEGILPLVVEEMRGAASMVISSRPGTSNVPNAVVKLAGRGRGERWVELVAGEETDGEQSRLVLALDISGWKRTEKIQLALYRTSEAVHATPTIEELYRRLHEIVGGLIPAENFFIALYDPGKDELSFPYFVDQMDAPPASRRRGRGLTEVVIRTGRPLLAPGPVLVELMKRGEADLVGSPAVDWLGVPLRTHGRTIGAIVVQSYTEGVVFDLSDQELLSFVSAQIAMTIERKRADEEIAHQAWHDPLTGLPNRLLLEDRLSMALLSASRTGQGLAVLFLDLDGFKAVNDSEGHAAGDWLLQEAAQRLKTAVRAGDTVARIGGDEFVVLLPDAGTLEDAEKVAKKLIEVFRDPFRIGGRSWQVGLSCGISRFPDHGREAAGLVASADAAMYRAKAAGKGTFRVAEGRATAP